MVTATPSLAVLALDARVDRDDASRQVGVAHVTEARLAHERGEGLLVGELLDALHQVLVRCGVVGHQPADLGYDVERVLLVRLAKQRVGHLAELEAHEAAARSEHAVRLGQRVGDPGDVADAEGDRVHVEALIVERQPHRVGDDPLQLGPAGGSARAQLLRASLALIKHLLVDVGYDQARPLVRLAAPTARGMRRQLVSDAEGDVPSATRYVEHLQVGAALRAHSQHAHEAVLPGTVDAGRHQVVHDVV
eukprot:CAMPEP_0118818962 /NCGR_PEP_ID=MMETSP1162-20130426/6567_1 /TAXON_ID=33656 /ORGANISM="Phaeocystis Sp, Strain CCMP2710" /LENGTH=248 /DNA_ID=CAMNT_0006749203 /DNA_START=48 /DNA_END=791 /DNA_ORIENTATION=-